MTIRQWLIGPVLSIPLLTGAALAAEPPVASGQADAGEPALAEAAVDGEAMAILRRMAERLARADGFSVSIRADYDVVQESGQKIEFGEERKIRLSRPSGLRIETLQSDGDRRVLVFDGKAISVFDPDQNVYAQVEKTGSVDEALRHLVRDLQVRLPLARLLVTSVPADLERRIQALDYVEQDRLTEVPSDHLAGQTADVDFQFWIAREGEPLPRRIVITYKHEEGQPQFWALFSDWDLAPTVAEGELAFVPPADAERIPFLVRVNKGGGAGEGESEHEGGQQ